MYKGIRGLRRGEGGVIYVYGGGVYMKSIYGGGVMA